LKRRWAACPRSVRRPPLLRWLRLPGVGYLAALLAATAACSAAAALLAVARWRDSRRRGAA
jgi:hypothetical protein